MSPDAQPLSKVTRSSTAKPGDEVLVLRSGAADPKDRVVLVPADKVSAASGVTVAAILNVLKAGPGVTVALQGSSILISSTVQAAAAPGQPDAPTAGVVNDIGDTFSFLPTAAYPAFAQYKVAGLPGVTGAVTLDGTNSYVQNGRIYVKVVGAVAAGGLAVYVAGSGNIPDGKPLLSNAPFTGTAIPTGDTTAPAISITVPTAGAVLTPGQAVTLTAQATDNVGVTGVTFTNGGTGAVLGVGAKNGNTYTYSYTPTAAGPLTITATAVDAAGNSQAASVSVTVQAVANSIPVANAGTDPSITLPTNQVVLQGSGTDADPGDTLTYAWRQVAGATVSGMPTNVRQPVITFPSAGTYQFGLIATDNHGAASAEDFVVVTVNAATTPPPSGQTQVAFPGDSLSTNYALTTANSYPQAVAALLTDTTKWQFAGLSGPNGNLFGHPGWTSAQLLSVTSEVDAVYTTNVALNVVVLWVGINDLALTGTPDIAALRSNVAALVTHYAATGYKVILCTLTSARGSGYASQHASIDAYRVAHNAWLRQNWQAFGASCLVDLATDYRLGQFSSGLDSTYFVDGIHMNAAGRAIVADMARQGIISVAAGLTVVVNGTAAPGSTVGISQDITGMTLVDDTSVQITKVGTWDSSPASNLGVVGGTHEFSNSVGASYSFTATTTKFKLRSVGLTNGANFTVSIDGQPYGGGTCYASPAANSSIVWESPTLSLAAHTIVVTIQDDNGKYLCLDAIYFTPATTGPPTTSASFNVTQLSYNNGVSYANVPSANKATVGGTEFVNCTECSIPAGNYQATTLTLNFFQYTDGSAAQLYINGVAFGPTVDTSGATAANTQKTFALPTASFATLSLRITGAATYLYPQGTAITLS